MSRRAEAGADVPVIRHVQHSPKAPEGTDLYTQIFLKHCFGNLSSQPEPASQSCSYTSLLHAYFPSGWDQCFASTGVSSWSGCSASRVAAGHCAGNLQPLPVFSLQENLSSTALVQMQPGSDSQGSVQPVCAPHFSWIRLSLQSHVTIPSISLQDLVCHQYVSLEGCESPACSLLYSLASPHPSRQSHNSLLLLLQFAKLPLGL